VASQSLVTFAVDGPDLPELATRLRALPGVEQVAAFGSALHVTSSDEARLESTIAPLRNEPGRTWQRIEPSLEDVFIHLMQSGAADAPAERRRTADAHA